MVAGASMGLYTLARDRVLGPISRFFDLTGLDDVTSRTRKKVERSRTPPSSQHLAGSRAAGPPTRTNCADVSRTQAYAVAGAHPPSSAIPARRS